MQLIEIYIEDQRLELFDDESVSITQSIQNVRDIAKVFTDFSKQFTIPASKTNNKIFKHYYNFDILNGFDARTKKSAKIELNTIPYLKGKIQLDGVQLKNNQPYSYKITFFGNIVNLKDLLGEDKLSGLNLTMFDQEYSANRVKELLLDDNLSNYKGTVATTFANRLYANGHTFASYVKVGDQVYNTTTQQVAYVTFNATTYLVLDSDIFQTIGDTYEVSNHILTPLISAKTRLYYDSSQSITNTGNLYWVNNTNYHGVAWRDLKYALRVSKILDAIQNKYTTTNGYSSNLVFSEDFFNRTNERWHNLYMWLHRKSGYVESGTQLEINQSFVDGWNDETGDFGFNYISGNYLYKTKNGEAADGSRQVFFNCEEFNLTLQSASSDLFDVEIYRNGEIFYEEKNIDLSTTSGTKTISLDEDATGTFHVVILSTTDIVFTNIQWEIEVQSYNILSGLNFLTTRTDTFDTSDKGNFTAFGTNFTFIAANQIPEMKVIDFLTGIFKMFNLTAFVEDDGTIYVDTLDNFYLNKKSQTDPYDISEYVDVNSVEILPALPFKEVKFTYKGTNSYLAKTHNQLFDQVWAEEKYTQTDQSNVLVGSGMYTVEAPFEHFKYERLYDQDTSTITDIQYGWSVGENQDSYIGEPLLFYIGKSGTTPSSISYVNTVNLAGDNFQSKQQITDPVNIPFNVTGSLTINFKAEIEEYTQITNDNTLFSDYYRNYILDVFNPKARMTKVKAYLPLRILLNFTLADRFRINDLTYKINSITTNLKTGESNIELLNVI